MTARAEALRLDDQLCFALYAASRALTRAYAPLLEPLGITYPQYLVMLVLWEEDGITMKRLGQRLELDSGTLTPLLKRLEKQRLVRRRRSDDDERVVHVNLTAAGRELRGRAKGIPVSLACSMGFDPADSERRAELVALRERLRAITQGVPPPKDGASAGGARSVAASACMISSLPKK
jgi:MarR family transcriptional regulator, organic hydroperoxide resistance regulator